MIKLSLIYYFIPLFLLLPPFGRAQILSTRGALSAQGLGALRSTVVAYKGPGDVVSGAKAWWGLRGYRGAYATGFNKAINIRRASDNATKDIGILISGTLDVATASSFCSSTTCYITKFYDQTGHGCHLVQNTAASQPTLSFNVIGSLPAALYSGNTKMATASNCPSGSQPITYSVVAEETSNTTSAQVILTGYNSNCCGPNVYFNGSGSIHIYAGSDVTAGSGINGNVWHALQVVFNGASSSVSADGTTSSSVNAGTNALWGYANNGDYNSPGPLYGYWNEGGIWTVGFSSTQISNMNSNQHSYWGF